MVIGDVYLPTYLTSGYYVVVDWQAIDD